MTRLILLSILFLLSLLIIFRAPTNLSWYVSILVTEFCWVFIVLIAFLLFIRFGAARFYLPANLIGIVSIVIYLLPIIQAYRVAADVKKNLPDAFPTKMEDEAPFNPFQMITGIGAKKVPYTTLTYDSAKSLTLDFYGSQVEGKRPCIVVIHGGSWAAGDSKQLPELNSEMAKWGYHVASINYRLAPANKYPAPIEDVSAAIAYLKGQSSTLNIDTSNFVLVGRSAGGQIALTAGYLLTKKMIKGVVCFYGPADMIWGYQNPTNPLVLDSRKIMEDYLGGSLSDVREQYVQSSATEMVNNETPPLLLIFGQNDPLVSDGHGVRLSRKLKPLNVKYYELYLPWATHAFDYTLNGPGGQLSTWATKHFIASVTQ